MPHILEDLKNFLDGSPTSYHAVSEIACRLALCDFFPLEEKEPWNLERGKKYFVIREGALCAFILPISMPKKMVILGSHTDSPMLKLKPKAAYTVQNLRLLGVEIYGAPLLNAWLNRDLCLAGRVITTDMNETMSSRLIYLDDAPVIIPQLAIHLDRDIDEKGLKLDKQEHVVPLAGLMKEEESVDNYLEKELRRHIEFKKLLGFDLFLVPIEEARFLGNEGELIAASRLDNLVSVHAAVTAMGMVEHPAPDTLQMSIFWDHEEIGSRTLSGASSSFLKDTLKRIRLHLGMEKETYLQMKADSFIVSIDAAQGFHPGFDKKYDLQHIPLLGKGIACKFNAGGKYATSGLSFAKVEQTLDALGLDRQFYLGRNTITCGSTIGPLIETEMGIQTLDIGIPILSMHSIREIASTKDHLDMCSLLQHLLQSKGQKV